MLTLEFAGLSVRLSDFLDTNYPRTIIQNATVEYSVLGTPSIGGAVFPEKYLWTINCAITTEQRRVIDVIAHKFHTSRRNLDDCNIIVLDETQTICESQRSRAIVPGSVSFNYGQYISYYAVFKAAITEHPKYTKLGNVDAVNMVLTETIRVLPNEY